jgi:hypothetical protein
VAAACHEGVPAGTFASLCVVCVLTYMLTS